MYEEGSFRCDHVIKSRPRKFSRFKIARRLTLMASQHSASMATTPSNASQSQGPKRLLRPTSIFNRRRSFSISSSTESSRSSTPGPLNALASAKKFKAALSAEARTRTTVKTKPPAYPPAPGTPTKRDPAGMPIKMTKSSSLFACAPRSLPLHGTRRRMSILLSSCPNTTAMQLPLLPFSILMGF